MKQDSMLMFDNEALHHSERKPRKALIKESQELPVHPKTFDWTILSDPERIGKKFEFDDFKTLFSFVLNLLKYQEEINHHGDIYVEHRSVSVEIFTHDVNAVTEIDLEFAKFCDSLFDDVQYHFIGKNHNDEE